MRQLLTRQKTIRLFAGTPFCDRLQNGNPFIIVVSAAVLLSIGFAASSFSECRQSYGMELDSLINPNNTPAASLVRLPGIGMQRARAIVAYRESFVADETSNQPFETINDLKKVRGIGPKTIQDIGKWLKFE